MADEFGKEVSKTYIQNYSDGYQRQKCICDPILPRHQTSTRSIGLPESRQGYGKFMIIESDQIRLNQVAACVLLLNQCMNHSVLVYSFISLLYLPLSLKESFYKFSVGVVFTIMLK